MDQSYDKDNDKDRGNTCTPILNLQIHFIVIYHRLCHKISMKEYSSFIMLYNKADFKNFLPFFLKFYFIFIVYLESHLDPHKSTKKKQ